MTADRLRKIREKVEELYTLYDVAELTGFSIVTVRRHMQKGALPTIKIGGARRVTQTDLIIYLKGTPGEGSVK